MNRRKRNTDILRHLRCITFCLLFISIYTSCESKDEAENNSYPKTVYSKIELKQVYTGDAQAVTNKQTYSYTKGRLTTYTVQQSYTAVEHVIMEQTTTIKYSDHKAIITDAFGNISTYVLNDEGYAISCERKEQGTENTRTYSFDYQITNGKHYLTQLTEDINGNEYSSIHIEYAPDQSLYITLHVDKYEQSFTAIVPATSGIPNVSEIPCLFLSELYPVSSHAVALYGKLLGEPYNVLIAQVIPEGNDKTQETITYHYETDGGGVVTSCREIINSYGTDYVRTVNYTLE